MRATARSPLRCLWLSALAIGIAGALHAAPSSSFCLTCHSQSRIDEGAGHWAVGCHTCHPGQAKYPHSKGTPAAACSACHAAVTGEHAASVHGQAGKRLANALTCFGCHGSAHGLRHTYAADFRKRVPALCGGCHEPIAREYGSSIHGRSLAAGVLESPGCTDCHGEHSIERSANAASSVSAGRVAETCGRCHGDVRLTRKFGIPSDRVVSFNATFHGLAGRQGVQTVANCSSCHGTHNILPSSDARSTIHARNLAATCSKCHPGAGTRFALGPVHVWPGRSEPAAVWIVRNFYTLFIPALGTLMLLHNGGDWVRKLRRLRSRRGRQAASPANLRWSGVRMTRAERVLHGLLAGSFIVLAWTGFDLVYPEQWWARPIEALEQGGPVRGTIHRAAALVFIGTVLAHLLSLARSREHRAHWRELHPGWADFKAAAHSLAHNLGLRREPPLHREYGFVEKLTYWCTVWGAALMILSGCLLWAHRFALAWMPKPLLDAAAALHFYEAVLGCVVLVVWHLYRSVFDPAIYPMDTTWIIGRNLRGSEEPAAASVER